ncbi:SAM-dependent methyltransferase [Pseudokineococcus marinus]|uniref:SAM-dependent methyltransferase n=1 Tax=Pseudokineococcus marinus TaxID=351215 RepID=A0A849BPR7_9ACTN|nr:SAM-dependent methyltransferase [Pseudokineococcus marinus]
MLVTPVANRVYAGDAPRLLAAELVLVLGAGGRPVDVAVEQVAGLPYVVLSSPGDLDDRSRRAVASASTAHALFERRALPDGAEALVPVPLPAVDLYDDDLLTIPKYPGKTNEHVTRLLLDLAVAALEEGPAGAVGGAPAAARRLRLLDPLAGRGTTLHLALMAGMDATGVEVDAGEVDAHRAFLVRWLRTKRLKHTVDAGRLKVAGAVLGERLRVEVSPSKEAARAGDVQVLEVLRADTAAVGPVLADGSFDLLVTDAPYGVQHGSARAGGRGPAGAGAGRGGATGRDRGGRDRGPRDLLERALPVWVPLLRRGGVLAMSWNTHVLPRPEVVALLERHGLEVLAAGEDGALAHRVDQAVHRDLVLARRPGRAPAAAAG